MPRLSSVLAAIAFCLSSISPLHAEMPKDIADAVKAIGQVIDVPATVKVYAPLHKKEPPAGVKITRDEKYGAADRNLLDIFTPAESGAARPVLIYVHGGGHVRGDRRLTPESPYYDNVMFWAVANGLVGVSITYRLAPNHRWPAGAEDIAAAVAWVKANAARIGGDPARIFLMGHSAGGTHVATYIAHPQLHKVEGSGLAGAILVSATYQLKPEFDVPEGQKTYFGDAALWEARSSLNGVAQSKLPLLVVHGEVDVPYYTAQAEALKEKLCAVQRCPTFVVLKGHSHMSEIFAINTADTSLSGPMLEFIKGKK